MKFGSDFFKIFNFVIQVVRLIIQIFGDEEDQQVVEASRSRTADEDPNHAL